MTALERPASSAVALRAWAASGAMWLTGRPGGAPRPAPGRPAALAGDELHALSDATRARTGTVPSLPGVSLLGERAAAAGLTRQGPWSCGRSFRAVATSDGWVGLSLARDADLALVPALVESEHVDEPWRAVASWAAGCSTVEAASRLELLGLPGSAVPLSRTGAGDRPPVVTTPGPRRAQVRDRPLVVDVTALWAGPRCAHLLGLAGADVVKVESTSRPDGARRGTRRFYDLLHGGHRAVAVDFRDPAGLAALLALLRRADLVLEASRPRALAQLGICGEELVAEGVSWLSITAAGRSSGRVGFGDDVAVGAGLFLQDAGDVLPCGDALADPLTGVVAARAAAQALLSPDATLVDVSMHDVCVQAGASGHVPAGRVDQDRHDGWRVDTGEEWVAVAPPSARAATAAAPRLGADTAAVLAEVAQARLPAGGADS